MYRNYINNRMVYNTDVDDINRVGRINDNRARLTADCMEGTDLQSTKNLLSLLRKCLETIQ